MLDAMMMVSKVARPNGSKLILQLKTIVTAQYEMSSEFYPLSYQSAYSFESRKGVCKGGHQTADSREETRKER